MASLDFARDFAKILKSQGIDFLLITFQDSKDCQIDAFCQFKNTKTLAGLLKIREHIDAAIVEERKKK